MSKFDQAFTEMMEENKDLIAEQRTQVKIGLAIGIVCALAAPIVKRTIKEGMSPEAVERFDLVKSIQDEGSLLGKIKKGIHDKKESVIKGIRDSIGISEILDKQDTLVKKVEYVKQFQEGCLGKPMPEDFTSVFTKVCNTVSSGQRPTRISDEDYALYLEWKELLELEKVPQSNNSEDKDPFAE